MTVAQLVQRQCGVSLIGNVQKDTGHGSEHSVLGEPALGRGSDLIVS